LRLCTCACRGTLGAGGDADLYVDAGVWCGVGFLEELSILVLGFGVRELGRGKLGFGGLGFECSGLGFRV